MQRSFRPSIQTRNRPSSLLHKIRIVTYNILADKYKGFNSYCSPEFLDWSYRYPRIQQQIQSHKPDILCLQEVEQTVYDQQLQPWLQKLGYYSLYQPRRTPADQQGPDEGVSLHFRAADFIAVAHSAVRFADADLTAQWITNSSCSMVKAHLTRAAAGSTTNVGRRRSRRSSSGSSDSSCCASDRSQRGPCRIHRGEHGFFKVLMQREEGCVMALLRHKASQQLLLACSTHLFWNPQFPDVKVAQAAILCSSVAEFIRQQGHSSEDVAVIIGGDFNSMPIKRVSDKWDQVPAGQSLISGVYQLLQQGQLHPSHQDHPARRTCRRHRTSMDQQEQQLAKLEDQQQRMLQASPAQRQQRQQRQEQESQQQCFVAGHTKNAGGVKHAHVAFLNELLAIEMDSGIANDVRQGEQQTQPMAVPASSAHPYPSSRRPVLSPDSEQQGRHGASMAAAGIGAGDSGTSSSSSMTQHVFDTAGLELASSSHMAHGREPVLTSRTTSFSGCLDYVWLSKQHFHVPGTLDMPYPAPVFESQGSPDDLVSSSVFRPCPNDLFPSDHLAVGCDVMLLPVTPSAARPQDQDGGTITGSNSSRISIQGQVAAVVLT